MFDSATISKPFRPMLASPVNMALLRYPCVASPKLDGVRCLAMGGVALSRSMKPLPNRSIQAWFAANAALVEGYDGELIIGEPTAPDCYTRTVSGVMADDGEPAFRYFVFDRTDMSEPYSARAATLTGDGAGGRIVYLESSRISFASGLADYEAACVDAGYEGIILRDPKAPYKQGRSTAKEGYLLKVKRFSDDEATITGFEEEMHNGNEGFTSEIGRTARSSCAAGLTGKGTLGAWVVKGLTAYPGIEFRIGTGMDAAYRAEHWTKRHEAIGRVVKFKHFTVGAKDAPRHPVLLGFRDSIDM